MTRLGWAVVLLSAAGVSFMVGGVRSWAATALVAAALAAALLTLIGERSPQTGTLPLVLAPLGLAAIYQTLMLVPLPIAAARFFSPQLAELRAFVWLGLGGPAPTHAPLALNPGVAALDAARLWATLVLAVLVSLRAQSRGSMRALFAVLATAGVAQVGIGALRFFELGVNPIQAAESLGTLTPGAFINPNHQAAFFNLSWPCSLVAAALSPPGLRRRAWSFVGGGLFLAALMTLSRAGIGAACVGGAVWLAAARQGRWSSRLPLLIGVGSILFLATYLAFGRILVEFMHQSTFEKTDIYPQVLESLRLFPFGAGRGGFAFVFNLVRPPGAFGGRWDYVENELLQAAVDYGWLGGVVAVAVTGYTLLRLVTLVTRDTPTPHTPAAYERVKAAGVMAIGVMLALHAFFDFNWELAGIFVPTWVLLACLGRPGVPFFAPSPWRTHLPALRWTLLAGMVLAPATLMAGLRLDPRPLEKKARESVADDRDQALELLVRTRPLDSWAHVMFADAALAKGDGQSAARWLNRALLVDPQWGEPHFRLATMLCDRGRKDQGRLELKLALERMPELLSRARQLLPRCVDRPGEEGEIVPESRPEVLVALVHLLNLEGAHPALPILAARYLASGDGLDERALGAFASWARVRKRDAEWKDIMAAWARLPESNARQAELAEEAWATGERERAISTYRGLAADPKGLSARLRLVDLLLATGELDLAEEANQELARDCGQQRGVCRSYHLNRATIFAGRGKPSLAVVEYRTILTRSPGDVDVALRAAAVLASMDQKRVAIDVLNLAHRAQPAPALLQRRAQLEAEVARDQQQLLKRLYLPE